MSSTILAATLLVAQAGPAIAHPVQPWTGDTQVLTCELAAVDGRDVQFVLTLIEDTAFIADARDAGISMAAFETIRPLPGVIRDQATMRRVEFNVGEDTVFVRQLYGQQGLERTFITVVRGNFQEGELPFERLVGFCQRAKQVPESESNPE